MKRMTCECGKVLGYEPRHAGKKVKCGGCGSVLVVPSEEEDEPLSMQPIEDEEPAPRPKARRPAKEEIEDAPSRRRRQKEDEEEEEEPEKPRRKRERNSALQPLANWLCQHYYIALVVAIAGAVCITVAIIQGMLTSNSSSTPQRISLADLAKNGPGDNLHVIVTGATPAERIVVQKKDGSPEAYFVPLLLPGADKNAASFPAILIVYENSDAKLNAALGQAEYKGTVVNSVTGLGSDTTNLLKQGYPGTDFSKVHLIQYGREPWSRGLIMTLMVVGALAVAAAVAMWLVMLLFREG
jgi:hypothetical protein